MKATLQLMVATALFTNFVSGLAATHYVHLHSPSPTAPFTNWMTAAHIIQDAVDAALAGDEVIQLEPKAGVPAMVSSIIAHCLATRPPLVVVGRAGNGGIPACQKGFF